MFTCARKYAESQYKPVPPLLEMFKNDAKTNAPHVVVGQSSAILGTRCGKENLTDWILS